MNCPWKCWQQFTNVTNFLVESVKKSLKEAPGQIPEESLYKPMEESMQKLIAESYQAFVEEFQEYFLKYCFINFSSYPVRMLAWVSAKISPKIHSELVPKISQSSPLEVLSGIPAMISSEDSAKVPLIALCTPIITDGIPSWNYLKTSILKTEILAEISKGFSAGMSLGRFLPEMFIAIPVAT